MRLRKNSFSVMACSYCPLVSPCDCYLALMQPKVYLPIFKSMKACFVENESAKGEGMSSSLAGFAREPPGKTAAGPAFFAAMDARLRAYALIKPRFAVRRYRNRHREAAKPPWRSSAICYLRLYFLLLDCFGLQPRNDGASLKLAPMRLRGHDAQHRKCAPSICPDFCPCYAWFLRLRASSSWNTTSSGQ